MMFLKESREDEHKDLGGRAKSNRAAENKFSALKFDPQSWHERS